jgi:hypothetical protein
MEKIYCLIISITYFENRLDFQIKIIFRLKMGLSCFNLIIHPIFDFIETHIRLRLRLSLLIIFNYFNIIIFFFLI